MKLKVSSDFSRAPGARYESEGKFSGESFRTQCLLPKFREAQALGLTLMVDLDGAFGYGTSFLEESFGGLIRVNKITLAEIQKTLRIVSTEEPHLIDEINKYMQDAEARRRGDAK